MIRSSGGNNDHPTSVNFMYSYKLMSCYSLLKPSRGSNVTGGENFKTFHDLTKDNKIVGDEEQQLSAYDQWLIKMDNAVSMGFAEAINDAIPDGGKNGILHSRVFRWLFPSTEIQIY
jgi:hypothetical protein